MLLYLGQQSTDKSGGGGFQVLQNLLKSSFVQGIGTGSSELRFIFNSLAFSFVSEFSQDLAQVVKTFIYNLSIWPNRQESVVYLQQYQSDCDSFIYKQFVWYISNKTKIQTLSKIQSVFSVESNKYYTSDDEDDEDQEEAEAKAEYLQIIPQFDTQCFLQYKQYSFQYTFESIECYKYNMPTSTKCGQVKIQVSFDNTQPILEFLAHVQDTYNKEQLNKFWKPQVFTPKKGLQETGWQARISSVQKSWETVALDANVRKRLRDDIDNFLVSEQRYKQIGLPFQRGYLLYGKPGCGKSSIINCISSTYKLPIYYMQLNEIEDDQTLTTLFGRMPKKSMVVFEDIDCMTNIVNQRTSGKVSDEMQQQNIFDKKIQSKVSLSCLLNVIDGVIAGQNMLMVMTTNFKEKLDSSLIREGRCDLQIELQYCTHSQLNEFYKIYFGDTLPQTLLDQIPEYTLQPSKVAGKFQQNLSDPQAAQNALIELVDCLQEKNVKVEITDDKESIKSNNNEVQRKLYSNNE